MSESDADFVTILSSELIATVVERYFNNEMYKIPVKVVDLKPTTDGYAFSLAFVTESEQLAAQKVKNEAAIVVMNDFYDNGIGLTQDEEREIYDTYVKSGDFKRNGIGRDNKGRFATVKQTQGDDNG